MLLGEADRVVSFDWSSLSASASATSATASWSTSNTIFDFITCSILGIDVIIAINIIIMVAMRAKLRRADWPFDTSNVSAEDLRL